MLVLACPPCGQLSIAPSCSLTRRRSDECDRAPPALWLSHSAEAGCTCGQQTDQSAVFSHGHGRFYEPSEGIARGGLAISCTMCDRLLLAKADRTPLGQHATLLQKCPQCHGWVTIDRAGQMSSTRGNWIEYQRVS